MIIVKPVEDLPLPKFPPTADHFLGKLSQWLSSEAVIGIRVLGLVEKRINKTRFMVAVFHEGEPVEVRVILSRQAGINNYPTSEARLAESVEQAFEILYKEGFSYACTWNKNIGSAVESYYVFYKPIDDPPKRNKKNEVSRIAT